MLVLKIGADSYYQGTAVPAVFRAPGAPVGPDVITTTDKSAAACFANGETAALTIERLRKEHQIEATVEPA